MGGFAIANNNLKAYWPDVSYVDQSSNSKNGTPANVTTFANSNGLRQGSYNGSTSDTDIPTSFGIFDGTSDFSYAAWFKPADVATTGNLIAFRGENQVAFTVYNSTLLFWWNDGTSYNFPIPIENDKWFFAVFTYDEGTNEIKGYMNGEDIGTDSATSFASNTNDSSIGQYNGGQDYEGDVGEVMIWDRVLSEAEQKHIYQKTYRS